jgi:hypothetical protein
VFRGFLLAEWEIKIFSSSLIGCQHYTITDRCTIDAGLNYEKISRGVDICLIIVIVITHKRFNISSNGGVETDLQGILFGGLSKQLGGSTANSPAIQTLH